MTKNKASDLLLAALESEGVERIFGVLVRVIAKRTPKCREVVRLLSQSMEAKLPVTSRIKIRLHYLICVWCYR